VQYRDYIWIEPERRRGQPRVKGTRIAVQDVLDYLACGISEAEIVADFPDQTTDSIRACLAYAADRERLLRTAVQTQF
jgi:uncharacterized protein (DUF433 family)